MSDQLVRRVAATQATVDAWRDKPFAWGRYDCARLAAFHLKQMGHSPGLAQYGFYNSALSAGRTLKKAGFDDVGQWIASMGHAPIAQASALPGDILGFRHEEQPLRVAVGISVGNGRMLAFLADQACHIVSPTYGVDGAEYYAWRVAPKEPA